MPKTTQQIVGDVQKQLERLGERMGSLGDFVTHLARNFQALGELSRRLTWQIAAMVGAPRFPFKGELYHALSGGKQGKFAVPTEDAGGGSGGEGSGYQTFEQKVAELRALHAERQKLYDADKAARNEEEKDNAYLWAAKREQTAAEKVAAAALAAAKRRAEDRGPNMGAPTPPPSSPWTPAIASFEQKAVKARAYAASQGMDEIQMPEHDPSRPQYREWVERMHLRASTAAVPASAAAAIPAPAAATKAGRLARFGSGLAASLRQSSLVASFFPKTVPYLTALTAAAQNVVRSFLGITAAAQGLVQAASPDLWQTFTQSLELLAGYIGQTLIPFFIDVAMAVQGLARSFHDLPQETKKTIGVVLEWGIALSATLAALVGLSVAVAALLSPIGLLSVAILAVVGGLTALADTLGWFKEKPSQKVSGDVESLLKTPEVQAAQERAKATGKDPADVARDMAKEEIKKRNDLTKEFNDWQNNPFTSPNWMGENTAARKTAMSRSNNEWHVDLRKGKRARGIGENRLSDENGGWQRFPHGQEATAMRHSRQGSLHEQVGFLRRQFLQDGDLPFTDVLTEEAISQALAAVTGWLDRIFSPLVTLWVFLSQVLSADHSCRAAVAGLIAHRLSRGQRPCSAETGAYCQARQRLPESFFADVACSVGRRLEAQAEQDWLWKGRRVYLFDGTTVTMPDTRENQAAYPQVYNQKPGLGFPIARIGALISLACGAVVNLGFCQYAGKGQGEVSLLRRLWDVLRAGDVVLGDRLLGNWATIVFLRERGVELVSRLNTFHRRVDFRRGRRLGPDDHVVRWAKPTSIRSLDREAYNALPDYVTVRETRIRVRQPGFRTRSIVVVTTLLAPEQTTKEDLATLYRARWHNELDLRSLKSAMQMRELRCKTPELVRKEVWAHVLAYNLIRTVMAQAAARHGVAPRTISFTGAMQTLEAFQPLLELGTARDAAGRLRLSHDLLDAIATHRVGDRPDRYEPRVKKRRRNHYGWLTEPRAEMKRKMAKGVTEN